MGIDKIIDVEYLRYRAYSEMRMDTIIDGPTIVLPSIKNARLSILSEGNTIRRLWLNEDIIQAYNMDIKNNLSN